MADLTVIILTYNEEVHIARAVASVASIAQQILVVDSHSTDRTVELAQRGGAAVLTHAFENQARQFQWALDHAEIRGRWTMRLDADEVIEPDLAAEIEAQLPILPPDVVGINLKRKHIWMGRWVRFGGRYPLVMLRIWRTGHGRIEDRWMDEHAVVSGGRVVTFAGGFADINLNDLSFFTVKHDRYATREAIEILNQRHRLFEADTGLHAGSASRQAAVKRWVKERIYNRIPFTLAALLYVLWRYVGQLGFLDGRTGLVYHVLQGYWYRFLVGAKVLEFERAVAHLGDKQAIVDRLSALTGLRLQRR